MCLFPRLIPNRRYKPNKKMGETPFCDDHRKLYVPVGCGKCIECMKQKALQWKIRLYEELLVQKMPIMLHFHFHHKHLQT